MSDMKNQKNHLQLTLAAQEDEEASRSPSHHALRPSVNGAVTISGFLSPGEHSNLPALLDELDAQTKAIWAGNLSRPEAMLGAQAHSLDTIYNVLAQKAAAALKSGNLSSTESYLRMALKCQGQCRMTLETLAEMKAPRSATFIRQQNVAEQQQVNNGPTVNGAAGHTRAHEQFTDDSSSNKLVSGGKNAALDTRRTRSASGIDSRIEDMGTLHRSSDGARKSRSG